MKLWLGLLLMASGICLGLYLGVWWAFVGGVAGCIKSLRAPELQVTLLGISIVKVLGASFIGWVSCIVLFVPGFNLFVKGSK